MSRFTSLNVSKMSFNEMGPFEQNPTIPDDTPEAKIEAKNSGVKEQIDAFDSFEALENDFDKIENKAQENLDQAKNMAETTMKKIEGLYQNSGTKMPENIRKGMETLFSVYFSKMGDAMKIVEEKILYVKKMDRKIQKAENNDNTERIEKLEQKKAEKIQEFYAQYSGIVKQYKDAEENIKKITNDHFPEAKTPNENPAIVTTPPIIEKNITTAPSTKINESPKDDLSYEEEEEEPIPEDEQTKKLVEKVTTERALEDKLSPDLLRLRKAGQKKLAELQKDSALAKKLGVTTFDNTLGGNTEKGGLQGIVELQKTIGSNPDGILGPKTELALANYEKKINAPEKTKASVLAQHPTWKELKDWGKSWQFEISNINELPNKENFPHNGNSCFIFHDANGEEYRFLNNDRVGLTKQKKIVNKADALALLGGNLENNENLNNEQQIERVFKLLGIPHANIESGTGRFGEYIGAYAMLNNQKADSLWFYPKTNKWRVMNPERTQFSNAMDWTNALIEIEKRIIKKSEAQFLDEMDMPKDDWEKFKNINKTELKKMMDNIKNFYKGEWTPPKFNGGLSGFLKDKTAPTWAKEIGGLDFTDLYTWLHSDKGKDFFKSNANTLDTYVKNNLIA